MRPWTVIIFGPKGPEVEEIDESFDEAVAMKNIAAVIRERDQDKVVLAIIPGMFKNRTVLSAL